MRGTIELRTERLLLRRHHTGDAKILHEEFGCDPKMFEYSGWNPYETAEMAENTVREFIASYDDPRFYGWAIDLNGQLVGTIGAYDYDDEIDEELIELAVNAGHKVEENMDEFRFNMALEEIWKVVRRANKYIDEKEPWALAKDESKKAELDTVMRNLAESLRIVSILIEPYMHTTTDRMREQLGLSDVKPEWEDAFEFYKMGGCKVEKGGQLFPRIDIDKELEELYALGAEAAK